MSKLKHFKKFLSFSPKKESKKKIKINSLFVAFYKSGYACMNSEDKKIL